MNNNRFTPLSYEEADNKAQEILHQMTLDEKIAYIGGDKSFFIMGIARLGLKEIYMADATQGVHLREQFDEVDLSPYQLEKSTSFPCPILLASTWNTDLAYRYAEAIGEECKAGGIGILLGPGMNIYRQSQCGRNFEYFGEDPLLAGAMVANYIIGLQSTGTIGTLKHFVANNTDYFRRKSNSVVDERTLFEIYTPAFKAGIDAGAMAVMTSYNLLNGEWCGEDEYTINDLLRKKLGFKWLVMSDWWSVYDGEKLAKSGQDLEMPHAVALKNAHELIESSKVKIEDIDSMVLRILRTYFAMKMDEYERDESFLANFSEHEEVALQTAREGIVLLKNDDNILPIKNSVKKILLTGDFVEEIWKGGGAAYVEGYNVAQILDAFEKELGEKLKYIKSPTIEQIQAADIVLCNIGTKDSEGCDRPFELPEKQEQRVMDCVNNNPNTIVIVTSGSGVRMTDWNDKAKAVLYCWYGGQAGNTAIAEIIIGKTNPSGKLPITIEKDFFDSPAHSYIPKDEELYDGWNDEQEKVRDVYDVHYNEGILVGYRWFEKKNIKPLYAFGHGLSYTTFEYSDLKISKQKFTNNDLVSVNFSIKNTGKVKGHEITQLYVEDVKCSFLRPIKELKGFIKTELDSGESKVISLKLTKKDFSFWNPETKDWFAEPGKFIIHVGAASNDIRLTEEVELL